MKKQPKLLIGIIVAITVIVVVVIFIVITAVGGSRDTYNSHMELAQRYLDELQYEQAIAEYEAAITIEPKNEDAYLGLADVYVTMGDTEKALEVLAEGYAQTQSERIAKRQEELEQARKENLTGEGQMSEGQEGEAAGNIPDAEAPYMAPPVTFVSWSEAGLEDHVRDWQDEKLEADMRAVTGIYDRDIMLSDVWEVTELYLGVNQISDISALSGLTNLMYLSLHVNENSDISALSGLTNLTTLWLYSNQISDISALSGLTNLGYLVLYNNQISDISALGNLSNLVILSLQSNQISDVSALGDLINLEKLELQSNQINDISALNGLANLMELNLHDNPIEDYSPVEFIEQNERTLNK